MKDQHWDSLASELARQNYVFMVSFSMVIWEYLTTFHQEVKYVWHRPSKATKYAFLLCRYYTLAYLILCSIFGTQWAIHIPASRTDCRTWFYIHMLSLKFIYFAGQLIIVRKVFYLYRKSLLLAGGLFALHVIQMAGAFLLTLHISHSLKFNPICNGRNIPNIVVSIIVSLTFNQCITWALIIRKVQPKLLPSWYRYLRTSDAQARVSCALCLVAILLSSSFTYANQYLVTGYTFTSPLVIISIGTCRYILRVERDKDRMSKLSEYTGTAKGKERQFVTQEHSHNDTLVTQRHRSSYRGPSAEMPSPLSDPEGSSIRTIKSKDGIHDFDTMVDSNFPYLHGSRSYKLKRSGRNTASTTTSTSIGSIHTNHPPPSASDQESRHTASIQVSNPQDSGTGAGLSSVLQVGPANGDNQTGEMDMTPSSSDIEIGSLQFATSVNSEELREFFNETWNAGPFMAANTFERTTIRNSETKIRVE